MMGRIHLLRHVQANKLFGETPLHPGQMPIMKFIIEKDGCSQNEIAEKLYLSPASIAISTKRLEKAGYITKSVSKNSLRTNSLHATEKGIEANNTAKEKFDQIDNLIYKGFTEEEKQTLSSFCKRMITNLQGEEYKTLSFFDDVAYHNKLREEEICAKKNNTK